MKKTQTLILVLFLFPILLNAQLTRKETKAVKKSQKHYENKEYKDAIATLSPVLNAHSDNCDLWELEITYRKASYEYSYSYGDLASQMLEALKGGGKNITIYMNEKKPEQYLQEFLESCYIATLKCEVSHLASVAIRTYLVDEAVDTAVSDEAKEQFKLAEMEFQKQNFGKAIEYYSKAIEIDSTFYQAKLYKGDSYYNMNEPENSLIYFKEAIKMYPNKLEPRKYLVDAYINMDLWEDAEKACIEAIFVYPGSGMFDKLAYIVQNQNLRLNKHWMIRNFEPNVAFSEQNELSEEPWKYYREAKEKILPYCDSLGIIIKPNTLTEQKYLEAYCWEYMLDNSKDEKLDFARSMQKKGFLDCYVLLSMYHFSVYKQYTDFSANNKEKLTEYIKTYLIE